MPIMFVISAAITLAFAAMLSAGVKFKQVFAILCYASVVQVIKWLLATVVVFLKNPNDFDLTNPLAFNLGAFMDPTPVRSFCARWPSRKMFLRYGASFWSRSGCRRLRGSAFPSAAPCSAAAAPTLFFVLLGASVAAMFG